MHNYSDNIRHLIKHKFSAIAVKHHIYNKNLYYIEIVELTFRLSFFALFRNKQIAKIESQKIDKRFYFNINLIT